MGNLNIETKKIAEKSMQRIKKEIKEDSILENTIIELCKKYTKSKLAKKYIIGKRELERDGLIFGVRVNKVVIEIRIRQWEE